VIDVHASAAGNGPRFDFGAGAKAVSAAARRSRRCRVAACTLPFGLAAALTAIRGFGRALDAMICAARSLMLCLRIEILRF
jgi:hypothetical protein